MTKSFFLLIIFQWFFCLGVNNSNTNNTFNDLVISFYILFFSQFQKLWLCIFNLQNENCLLLLMCKKNKKTTTNQFVISLCVLDFQFCFSSINDSKLHKLDPVLSRRFSHQMWCFILLHSCPWLPVNLTESISHTITLLRAEITHPIVLLKRVFPLKSCWQQMKH